MSKYIRSNFIKTVNNNGLDEKDFLMNAFQFYKFKRPFTKYRLTVDDYMRPDKISAKVYGVNDYWWLILKLNPEIQDIWNDFVIDTDAEEKYPDAYKVGEMINLPNILDIQEFYTFSKNELENI